MLENISQVLCESDRCLCTTFVDDTEIKLSITDKETNKLKLKRSRSLLADVNRGKSKRVQLQCSGNHVRMTRCLIS